MIKARFLGPEDKGRVFMGRTILPLLATVIVLAVNAAANIVPINGLNTGELSALYPTGFTPPGWVFSIWLLIYIGLLSFSFAAIRGAPRTRARIAPLITPYLFNALGNAGWIFAWHYRQVPLSVALMLLVLGSLIVIFWRLRQMPTSTWSEFFVIDGVFAIYFGWISTATLVNFATLFYDRSWYPFGLSMDEWALITVVLATAIYVWMGVVTRSILYCAVFVWAATGVYLGEPSITQPVRLAAATGIVAVLACMVWMAFNPRRRASLRGP